MTWTVLKSPVTARAAKKKHFLLSDRAQLTNKRPQYGGAVLCTRPLKRAAHLVSSLCTRVHYYYIIVPGVYIENDLTHLLTTSRRGGTQKA